VIVSTRAVVFPAIYWDQQTPKH